MSANLLEAIPVLRVSDFEAAEAFYCGKLGFLKDWAYQPEADNVNPTYAGLSREGIRLQVSSFSGDGSLSGVVYVSVRDVDRLYQELIGNGVAIDLEPTDQTWGNREMYVKDADGNSLRFCQPSQPTATR
jgi:catechol 2,3-dioxygenase-like lactoylglutathione lyase family enzyme